jgi:FlaA1/EpsC-like NDP-sugar epimerase
MLAPYQFRWHSYKLVAIMLFFISGEDTGWATNPESLRPCNGRNALHGVKRNEDIGVANLSVSESAKRNRVEINGVASGFCVTYFAQNLVSDQKAIWASPMRLRTLRPEDRNWLVPLGIGTLGLLAADQDIMWRFGSTPSAHSNGLGNYGLASMIVSASSLYVAGLTTKDDHSRETGFLAGEAAVDSVIVGESMSLLFRRPRPNALSAGSFGAGGASFPSEHALAAWSIATVIAQEYPGPMTKLLAYGAAAGISDAMDVLKAVLAGSVAFLLVMRYGLGLRVFPLSIYALEALITFTFLTGVRVVSRILDDTTQLGSGSKRLLLVGAGHAAQLIIRETQKVDTGYTVVGCVDDDPLKKGWRVVGVPVLGPVSALAAVVRQQRIDEVLIAIPSATHIQMHRLVAVCRDASAPFRTVPGMAELIAGRVMMQQVREVSLTDLLGRIPVDLDLESVREYIRDRVVMVTGAAGSIGSELCRQIRICRPKVLLCLDQNETGIFNLEHQFAQDRNTLNGIRGQDIFCVADFSNPERMRKIFLTHGVEIVFHAAAYKHVPVMEANAEEAVNNNVFGLLSLLNVAQNSNCEAFVMISSDKAVNPTNVMGCTKRLGELILAAWPGEGLRCVSVRFGNVLGSNGSVIPLFQEQIRQNLPITLTHPEMTRFFMMVSEAVSLVLQGFAVGRHGDILVLDMGEPVRVADLARTLVRLSGKLAQEFEVIGLRPGEKLFEELFYPDERVFPSACAKIACTESAKIAWPALKRGLDDLYVAMLLGKRDSILAQLQQIVPQFSYAGSYETSRAETEPISSNSSISETPRQAPAVADMPGPTYRSWEMNPLLGPTGGSPGD